MLRPSRPMIRPFISSEGSSTRRVVESVDDFAASRCIATARMLRARRSASAFVSSSICWRRAPGALLRLLLDLGDQHLLRLRRAEAGEPLELAPLDPLRLLQLLELVREVALAVLERLHPALELGPLDDERVGLAQRPLLHPRDLGSPGAQLVLDLGARRCRLAGRRGRRALERLGRRLGGVGRRGGGRLLGLRLRLRPRAHRSPAAGATIAPVEPSHPLPGPRNGGRTRRAMPRTFRPLRPLP